MNTLNVDQATLWKIIHDLRGPLVNLKGFHSELDKSFGYMLDVIDECGDQLPRNVESSISNIVNDDLIPILRYFSISIDQLHERLDMLEKGSTNTEP